MSDFASRKKAAKIVMYLTWGYHDGNEGNCPSSDNAKCVTYYIKGVDLPCRRKTPPIAKPGAQLLPNLWQSRAQFYTTTFEPLPPPTPRPCMYPRACVRALVQ